MIELVRMVEHKAGLSSFRATQNLEHALQLELMIEKSKPQNLHREWHTLIATPFRYHPPHPHARFRPPYGKNIFYASLVQDTVLYEHAYHFMKQRIHLEIATETGTRIIFKVNAHEKNSIRINDTTILDKNNYSASHKFVSNNPQVSFIFYPSCRDPEHRYNAIVLDINHLEKIPKWQSAISFFYDNRDKKINWLDYELMITWNEVA